MKRCLLFLGSLLAISLLFESCGEEIFGIRGSGSIISENRTAGNFDEIEVSIYAEVEIVKDSLFNVEVSDYENLLEHITTTVHGTTLIIKSDADHVNLRNSQAKVNISMPSLKNLAIRGSGKIRVLSGFSGLQDISISGSGEVEAADSFDTAELNVVISGSGDITAAGSAEELNTNISGSGDIHLFDLVAQHATCRISGSGNTYVNAVQTLNATISGSGNIEYMGTPVLTVNISGSGKVRGR